MGRYRTINVDLNRQYRNDLNANFAQIEQDILGQENFTVETKNQLLAELSRIEQESKERDNALAKQNLEVLLQSIEDAKANANTAASNANTKANYANEQGDYAKTQGDYAKSQGDYAKTKGDYADEKAQLANQAAANANDEASNLSQLKVDVVTATQDANTATTNANSAASNATAQANYAKTQGDYAKQQAERAQDIVDGTGLLTQTDIGVLVAGFNSGGQVLDKNGNVVEGKVKTVNNIEPDANGNIEVTTFSGDYNDLSNKPTIPTKTSELTNDTGFLTTAPVTSVNGQTGDVTVETSVPDASTSQKGIVRLTNSLTSTSEVLAPTANALNQVNLKANTYIDNTLLPTTLIGLLNEGMTVSTFGISTSNPTFVAWRDVVNTVTGFSSSQYYLTLITFISVYDGNEYGYQLIELSSVYDGYVKIGILKRAIRSTSYSDWTFEGAEFSGSGSPEGSISAYRGAKYFDYTNKKMYWKSTGTSSPNNTGWVVV